MSAKRAPLSQRAETSQHPLARKLLRIMEEKKTNLCVAADVDRHSSQEVVNLAKLLGPHICMLKVQKYRFDDFRTIVGELTSLAKQYNFLLFEDAKFADVPSTIEEYYASVVDWADIVTVHGAANPKVLEAIDKVSQTSPNPRGVFVVCEMSDQREPYDLNKSLQLVKEKKRIVVGVIAQEMQLEDDQLIKATPGVHLTSQKDGIGQNYRTPESVCHSGSDIVIVGRGIIKAPDDGAKLAAALEYKNRSWQAFVAAQSP